MKKILVAFALISILAACNSSPIEKPDNLIEEDKMVNILYDLYLVNAMKNEQTDFLNKNNITPANYIYNKYKIDSLQFAQSDQYYAANLEVYEQLYQEVTTKIQKDKAQLDTLIARNPQKQVKKEKPVLSLETNKAAVGKKEFVRKKVFKGNTEN